MYVVLIIVILMGVKQSFLLVLICISLMVNDSEHLSPADGSSAVKV